MTDTLPTGAPAPGTYILDPERTTIRADVKAMFGVMTVHGTFRLQSRDGYRPARRLGRHCWGRPRD